MWTKTRLDVGLDELFLKIQEIGVFAGEGSVLVMQAEGDDNRARDIIALPRADAAERTTEYSALRFIHSMLRSSLLSELPLILNSLYFTDSGERGTMSRKSGYMLRNLVLTGNSLKNMYSWGL